MSTNSSNGDIENLLFIMANLPDFLKLSVCRKKVKELLEMNESEKKETIARSLTSINLINQDKLVELTKTWMKVISEIEPDELTKLLYIYLLILDDVKLFNKIDGKLILNIFYSLEEVERIKLLVCLKEAVFLNPTRGEILKKIPADLVKVILN
ncbi:MAG TPA: hypothetical protein VFR61_08205 [Nitrososphaeraceae archaeon]|nr:hypothetical protein [Nitrososphaeraceae archaeon]